jgi:acetyl-CoA carboxylase biotin carboxylase subunit
VLTFDQIKELIDLVWERGLTGLEIERQGFRIRIDGRVETPAQVMASEPQATETQSPSVTPGPEAPSAVDKPAPAETKAAPETAVNGHVLKSPIVGTFYRSPNPDADPYVKKGDEVKVGQVLCIVEAMKLMNEIESDQAGVIEEIYTKNAQPVEFGEPLFLIRMFKKILVANRGEIALRVIHACRELGIKTVAVHSTADADSLHVAYADEAVCIGPPPSAESYLNVTSIISAAEITGADAVHPGYGFLAENAAFAEVLEECQLEWIGPPPESIRLMGDKSKARRTAAAAGVPVLPGSREPLADAAEAAKVAAEVGFPVILKAAAGGGGRGMRIVQESGVLASQFETASQEALKAFGDGSIYLERFLMDPRHIEFQIFGDKYDRVIHLGERECSIQRRHQKLIEEAPSPALTDEMRQEMGEAAVKLAAAAGYTNAGTVEFLLDRDGSFYFMEMNTRIQVEHPVTELVKLQIQVAAGERLTLPDALVARGHAIECRINAENAETFNPSPGRVETFHAPGGPGIRVDTHVYEDYFIPPHYDSLIAKLISYGRDREEAVARMERALDFFVVDGVDTSIPLHQKIMRDPRFRAGNISTHFMERFLHKTPAKVASGAES